MEPLLRQYAAALLPDERRVLGRVMLPMTLGHALLLARLNSPFVVVQPTIPLLGDLRLAMFVCSRPYARAARQVNGRYAWLRLYLMNVGLKHLLKGIEQFAAYVAASRSMPDSFDPEPSSGTGGWMLRTPFLLQVKLSMKTDFGMSEAEVMDVPLGQALWEFMGWQEMQGRKRLVGEQDADRQTDAEEALKKFGPELKAFREQMAGMSIEQLRAYDPARRN
jgi:hypothetical protein